VNAVYPKGDMGVYGVFARFADGSGLTACATNPFLLPTAAPAFSPNGTIIHVGYHPAQVWNFSTQYSPIPSPYEADAGLLGIYMLTPNYVPPSIETYVYSRRYREISPYAGSLAQVFPGELVHSLDTNSGMLFETVHFPQQSSQNISVTLGAPPGWINNAERDALRAMAEAHFLLPTNQTVRIHIPWT